MFFCVFIVKHLYIQSHRIDIDTSIVIWRLVWSLVLWNICLDLHSYDKKIREHVGGKQLYCDDVFATCKIKLISSQFILALTDH